MMNKQVLPDLEIWGGLECTINRVGNTFFDQLTYSGHWQRMGDIRRFSELGIQKIRYPVLWEKHQPLEGQVIDWRPVAQKLEEFKAYGIEPIAGLLHHGSGPAFTHLLDPEFPEKFSAYAFRVAKKFPWINYYTPINEPLTTARFSGLYGLWYPHSRDDKSFLQMLINQCKASVLSMRAIRSINPNAIWLQTEDLGKTHSTPSLQYQADFENHRRWLTFDLWAAQVNPGHPLWDYLLASGIDLKQLDFFNRPRQEPDLIGFNYYVTSERYLDENLEKHPAHTHGGNTLQAYADVEAVRARPEGMEGIGSLLQSAWQKLRKPMVISEMHLHCSRDEQLRWFKEIWQEAKRLKENGIPVKAVTAWALLGAFGWNHLLIGPKGDYESGVFDISNGKLRPTALAAYLKELSQAQEPEHPVLEQAGWWHREIISPEGKNIRRRPALKPIVIIGKNGTLGRAFARVCEQRAINFRLIGRPEIDINNYQSIEVMMMHYQPWAIINASGYVQVDRAELEPESCFSVNTKGAVQLAKICAKHGVGYVAFSSDLVFNGSLNRPYLESDETAPLNIYGQSKAMGEKLIKAAYPVSLLIRTSAFFGLWDEANFAHAVLQQLNLKQLIYAAKDQVVSPTYVPELVNRSLDLLIDKEKGIWHLSNKGHVSWADFARLLAEAAGYSKELIIDCVSEDLGYRAIRPAYSVLGSERGALMGDLDKAIYHFIHHRIKTY